MIIMKLLCDACSCAGGALEFGPARRGAILKNAPRRAAGDIAQTLVCARHLQRQRGQALGRDLRECGGTVWSHGDTRRCATVSDKRKPMNRLTLRIAKFHLICFWIRIGVIQKHV